MSDTRDKLAAWLHRERCDMGHKEWAGCTDDLGRGCEDLADALLASDVLRDMLAEAEARALRDAADDPTLRLSGHSGISVRGLRDRADRVAQDKTTISDNELHHRINRLENGGA